MRTSFKVLLMMEFLNASVEVLRFAGLASVMGDHSPGAGQHLRDAVAASQNITAGTGLGDTLFGMYTALASVFKALTTHIFAAPTMFLNMGIPDVFVLFFVGALTMYVGGDMIYMLIGRSYS